MKKMKRKAKKILRGAALHTGLLPLFMPDNQGPKDKSENLFVISHFGQLVQVEGLIRYKKIEDNILVILYTTANKRMPELIVQKYDRSLFKECVLFLLPLRPNDFSIFKQVYINRNYKNLVERTNAKSVFLLSFEKHYSVLASMVKERGALLNLIEEGTATYKSRQVQEEKFYNKIICMCLVFDPHMRNAMTRWEVFDTVYGAYPRLLKGLFEAKNYEQYFAHSIDAGLPVTIQNFGITEEDMIYVNQRYPIKDSIYAEVLVDILDTIAENSQRRIFIKMHPKDSHNLKIQFQSAISQKKKVGTLLLIENDDFIVEAIIKLTKPKAVIGLTSTTLVYAPLVSKETKVISIAPFFLEKLKMHTKRATEQIWEHYKILENFEHIRSLLSEKDLTRRLLC